jgi:hypothetical protein
MGGSFADHRYIRPAYGATAMRTLLLIVLALLIIPSVTLGHGKHVQELAHKHRMKKAAHKEGGHKLLHHGKQ